MKHTWRNTWTVLETRERKRFVLLVLSDSLVSIADIFSLALLLWILNFYVSNNVTTPAALPGWLASKDSVGLIALFFVFFSVKNMMAWWISKSWYSFIAAVAVRISGLNLSVYQRTPFRDYTETDSSVYLRKIGLLPFEFCQYVLSGIPQIITQSSLILLTIIAIVLFNAKLFLLLLLVLLPPVIVVFYFIRSRLQKVKREITAGHEKSFQHLLDALKGYVEGNIYQRNDFFRQRFVASRKKFSQAMFGSLSIQGLPPRVIEIFAVLGLFVLLIIAKWAGHNESDYLVTIGAFVGAAYKIIPGIVKIINISGQVSAYGFTVAELAQNASISPGKKLTPPTRGIDSVELKNIQFKYERQAVLQDLSFRVKKGDFLVITGDSGKGKTTILNILLGFVQPSAGELLINEQPVTVNDPPGYWPHISYVKQQSFLLHDTILRNITLEEDSHQAHQLAPALKLAGIHKLADLNGDGLLKTITENGKNISGGQRQRIAIARALYKNADLIILDEPFNELDEASECMLLRHFKELADAGKIVILITHNQKSLSCATQTLSLDEKG